MGKLKKLLKLRKQSDTVKLIMLIMILGIAMLIGVFYEGVKIYIDLQNEVEYITWAELVKKVEQNRL